MKVAIGLSGGVDSSVAALLLKEQDHEVVGVTMKLWREGRYRGGDRGSCFGAHEEDNIAVASETAKRLGIEYRVFDCFEEYDREIISYFRDTYLSGKTPNPCVRCNAMIKFGLLPKLARSGGLCFDKFATGHYARIGVYGGRWAVRQGADETKDQSYFLCRLSQEQLEGVMFPLGDLTKQEIRRIAREHNLVAADRPDSQDFYSGDRNDLIGAPDKEGDVVDTGGKVIGKHRGFWHYTIGQRKGLGIGGGTPFYVIDINACRNQVVVGFAEEAVRESFSVGEMNFMALDPLRLNDSPVECRVKVRSAGHPRGPAMLRGNECFIKDGIRGIAPGQSAVFYAANSDEILASGTVIQ